MNSYFLAAACLAIILGLIHSVLGERLIFSRLREGSFVPTKGKPILKEQHLRIIWATWHLVTITAWGFAAILIQLAFPSADMQEVIKTAILLSMFCASMLVLYATKGKHPGWIVLLVISVLLYLA